MSRFEEHQTSECHKVAIDYDVIDITSKSAKKTRAQNRRCFAKIIESLQYLARQGLAIRGDNDEESNFIQLLKLRAKDDEGLAKEQSIQVTAFRMRLFLY